MSKTNEKKLNQQANMVASESEKITNATENTENTKKTTPKSSMIQSVINTLASGVADLVEKQQARKEVESKMVEVLGTVFGLCALDEYAVGIRVKDTLYRYSDYVGPASFNELLAPKRVVLTDSPSAKNFLKTSVYGKVATKPVDPTTFLTDLKLIMKALRVNSNLVPLSRSDKQLLAEATKNACDSGKVEDRNNKTVLFLESKFDEEKQVDVLEWAKTRAITLFE